MGATVLTGKRAAAFQKANGDWMFALFERTYEKNCYPHDDHWSAIAFGGYAEVMRRVFRHASSCEGGMLQSRAGNIKPENYISSWRAELSKPLRLPEQAIRLGVSSSYRAALPEGSLGEIRQSLVDAGFGDRVDELTGGSATLMLVRDCAILEAIYGEKGPLSLWRVLDVSSCSSVVVDGGVPLPARSESAMNLMPAVECYAIDDENRLVLVDGQPWENAGWKYSAVGSFITEMAYDREMKSPGFAKRAIPAYREILQKAERLPADTMITVTRAPDGAEKHWLGNADELAVSLGLANAADQAPVSFSFRFGDLPVEPRNTLVYKLCGLRSQQVTWDVQRVDEVQVTSPPVGHTDLTQLALEWM
jgi:hypothetical protein